MVAKAKPVEAELPPPIGLAAALIDAADEQAGIHAARADPYRLAQLHLRMVHHHAHRPTLACQGDEILAWDGFRWVDATRDIDSAIFQTARGEFERQNMIATANYHKLLASEKEKPKPPPTVRIIKDGLIRDVKLALRSLVSVPADRERPCWLGGEEPWPTKEVVAFPNALVYLRGLAADDVKYLADPTPWFFCTRCMGFAFDASAPKPSAWLSFLDEIFGDDEGAVQLLQEWFGYCLTDDTSQQKILMVVGPTRSGKGTLGRILTGLLGPESVAGPSFTSFATNFGAESLIGMAAAVVGDARLSGRSDQAVITERLLSISGEDRITVDRKYRRAWMGTLPTRLMLLSNELPELKDASLALANRLLIIRLKKSFLGGEDRNLTDRLMGELPGILLWAVEGWKRLHERGHFVQPESSREVVNAMKDLSSHVSAFVNERCVVDPKLKVPTEDLFKSYQQWCQGQGRKPLDKSRLGRDLNATVLGVSHQRLKESNMRTPYYLGLALLPKAVVDKP